MKTISALSSAIRWFQTCQSCDDKPAIYPLPTASSKAFSEDLTDSDDDSEKTSTTVSYADMQLCSRLTSNQTPSCISTPLRTTDFSFPSYPSHILNVVIVGAGIGGLATAYLLGKAGHHVTILESAAELSEVGAGIQLSPNATRLLSRWGLGDELERVAVAPQNISLRKCTSST